MKFSEIYQKKSPVFSLEFFPPRSEDLLEATFELINDLARFNPDYMTVTYGAGGGTRERTRQIVSYIHNHLHVTAVSHLTCVGHNIAEIDEILSKLESEGISNILALRGDPQKGQKEFKRPVDGFPNARELAKHIYSKNKFSIAVAGYPETHQEAVSWQSDIEYLKEKVDSGAEIIITQLFFDNQYYYRFLEKVRGAGITIPVIPGIMPVANVAQVVRFTNMCGATIPEAMRKELYKLEADQQAVVDFGIDYAIAQCHDLLKNGAAGLHLYTLNKSNQIRSILEELT